VVYADVEMYASVLFFLDFVIFLNGPHKTQRFDEEEM